MKNGTSSARVLHPSAHQRSSSPSPDITVTPPQDSPPSTGGATHSLPFLPPLSYHPRHSLLPRRPDPPPQSSLSQPPPQCPPRLPPAYRRLLRLQGAQGQPLAPPPLHHPLPHDSRLLLHRPPHLRCRRRRRQGHTLLPTSPSSSASSSSRWQRESAAALERVQRPRHRASHICSAPPAPRPPASPPPLGEHHEGAMLPARRSRAMSLPYSSQPIPITLQHATLSSVLAAYQPSSARQKVSFSTLLALACRQPASQHRPPTPPPLPLHVRLPAASHPSKPADSGQRPPTGRRASMAAPPTKVGV